MRYIVLALLLALGSAGAEPRCTYSTYKWNTGLRKAVDFESVDKPRAALAAREKDRHTGCTVCEQDQVVVSLPGVSAFSVCRVIAGPLRGVLAELLENGAPIRTIVGYRVGMTRGDVDARGNRTRFSNHSFGVAIDINPRANGLYDRCIEYDGACRLMRAC